MLNRMQYRESRLRSFYQSIKISGTTKSKEWTNDKPEVTSMLENGFYFTPTSKNLDQVTCIGCGKKEHNINEVDNIVEYHLLNNPECPLSIIILAHTKYIESNHKENFWESQSQSVLRDPFSRESIDIRKKTFRSFWKFDKLKSKTKVTSRSLSEAGFYFTPLEDAIDEVSCMYCGRLLDHWDEGDDPLIEHQVNVNGYCYFLEKKLERDSTMDHQNERKTGKINSKTEKRTENLDEKDIVNVFPLEHTQADIIMGEGERETNHEKEALDVTNLHTEAIEINENKFTGIESKSKVNGEYANSKTSIPINPLPEIIHERSATSAKNTALARSKPTLDGNRTAPIASNILANEIDITHHLPDFNKDISHTKLVVNDNFIEEDDLSRSTEVVTQKVPPTKLRRSTRNMGKHELRQEVDKEKAQVNQNEKPKQKLKRKESSNVDLSQSSPPGLKETDDFGFIEIVDLNDFEVNDHDSNGKVSDSEQNRMRDSVNPHVINGDDILVPDTVNSAPHKTVNEKKISQLKKEKEISQYSSVEPVTNEKEDEAVNPLDDINEQAKQPALNTSRGSNKTDAEDKTKSSEVFSDLDKTEIKKKSKREQRKGRKKRDKAKTRKQLKKEENKTHDIKLSKIDDGSSSIKVNPKNASPDERNDHKGELVKSTSKKGKKFKFNTTGKSHSPEVYDLSNQNIGDYEEVNMEFHEKNFQPRPQLVISTFESERQITRDKAMIEYSQQEQRNNAHTQRKDKTLNHGLKSANNILDVPSDDDLFGELNPIMTRKKINSKHSLERKQSKLERDQNYAASVEQIGNTSGEKLASRKSNETQIPEDTNIVQMDVITIDGNDMNLKEKAKETYLNIQQGNTEPNGNDMNSNERAKETYLDTHQGDKEPNEKKISNEISVERESSLPEALPADISGSTDIHTLDTVANRRNGMRLHLSKSPQDSAVNYKENNKQNEIHDKVQIDINLTETGFKKQDSIDQRVGSSHSEQGKVLKGSNVTAKLKEKPPLNLNELSPSVYANYLQGVRLFESELQQSSPLKKSISANDDLQDNSKNSPISNNSNRSSNKEEEILLLKNQSEKQLRLPDQRTIIAHSSFHESTPSPDLDTHPVNGILDEKNDDEIPKMSSDLLDESTPTRPKSEAMKPLYAPLSITQFEDDLLAMNDTIEYLDQLPTAKFGLYNDYEGIITEFIAAMPEEEENMTIEEWIRHNAASSAKTVREISDKMIKAYENSCDILIKEIEELPETPSSL